jgi:hypothetical protein
MLQLNLDIKEKIITMYESGAQKSCIQKTNDIFSIYKMSEQQKLGKIQKAKTLCNQIEKKINENILFRKLLWGEQNWAIFGKLLSHSFRKRDPVESKQLCIMNLTRL